MKTNRFAAALSLATVAAAFSAVAMSAAQAGQTIEKYAVDAPSAATPQVLMSLDLRDQSRDLPAPGETRFALQRLHGGPVRIAKLEMPNLFVSNSAPSSLPTLALN